MFLIIIKTTTKHQTIGQIIALLVILDPKETFLDHIFRCFSRFTNYSGPY